MGSRHLPSCRGKFLWAMLLDPDALPGWLQFPKLIHGSRCGLQPQQCHLHSRSKKEGGTDNKKRVKDILWLFLRKMTHEMFPYILLDRSYTPTLNYELTQGSWVLSLGKSGRIDIEKITSSFYYLPADNWQCFVNIYAFVFCGRQD